MIARILAWFRRKPPTELHFRHLHGSKRIYLYGDGIEAGWYRLEERKEVQP